MNPKYSIGDIFGYVDNMCTVYMEIIGIAPELNYENDVTYFVKVNYEYDEGNTHTYFEAEEEGYLSTLKNNR